jgi:hypothetical protein
MPEITNFHQPRGFEKARPSGGAANPTEGVFSNGTVGLAAVALSLFIVSFPVGGVLPPARPERWGSSFIPCSGCLRNSARKPLNSLTGLDAKNVPFPAK